MYRLFYSFSQFKVLLAYWTVTYYGISIVKTDLSVQNLAPRDARIVQFKVRYDQVIKVAILTFS